MATDRLYRFVLERSGVRGLLVQLGASWRSIGSRVAYPPALAGLLGETVAAAALFGGHVKIDGRLGIQLKGDGNLHTLYAEAASNGNLRGLALWQDPLPDALGPRDLGDNAVLAITIENRLPGALEPTRYQGLVALQGECMAQAFEGYFARSEQLPTRLLLAAGRERAGGLMLQQLPDEARDPDGWTRAQALFDTLAGDELLATPAEQLLLRLFHEDGVRLLGEKALAFGCSCSRERVAATLIALGRVEAFAALEAGQGTAEVACEFCNQHYRFDRVDLEQVFAGGGSEPAPERAN